MDTNNTPNPDALHKSTQAASAVERRPILDPQTGRARYGFQPQRGREPLPTTAGDLVPLHAFLPDSGLLPDDYEPAWGEHGDATVTADPADTEFVFAGLSSSRTYTRGGIPRPRDAPGSGQDAIAARVMAVGDEETPAGEPFAPTDRHVEAAHEWALAQEYEPGELTDWIESAVEESRVEGYRRTTLTARIPILQLSSGVEYPSAKPYREAATVVQSVPWGTIGVSAHFEPVQRPDEARDVVLSLVDDSLRRVLEAEGNVMTSTAEQNSRPGTDGDPEPWVTWEEMSMLERERVVVGALRSYASHATERVEREQVVGHLEACYDAERGNVVSVIDLLAERGDVTLLDSPRLSLGNDPKKDATEDREVF